MTIRKQDYAEESNTVKFSTSWEVLGPFQIGTREATWGADPLESLGGFHTLQHDSEAQYKSSLTPNGVVFWSSTQVESSSNHGNVAEVLLKITFPHVDWSFLQAVYGWAALQYQAWARGHMTITGNSPQCLLLYTDNVLEFWLDDHRHFGGDFYGYRRAPLVVHLEPGIHRLDVRLIRDGRLMGSVGEPSITIRLTAMISSGGLSVIGEGLLMPDVVNDHLASPFASMIVRNDEEDSLDILSFSSQTDACSTTILEELPLRLAPGQSRPLAFRISQESPLNHSVSFELLYCSTKAPERVFNTSFEHVFRRRDIHTPHKITFLHPSSIVSYAILRAPSKVAASRLKPKYRIPILLNLHGAGVEADDDEVRHMLDAVPDLPAWVLFPTGVTSWSADDWHTWGFADVEAAANSIVNWIHNVNWEGPSVDAHKWLVSGHSNGGQGTWYALTRRPDCIIGAAPVSGYASIQAYVSYQMWTEADPKITAVLQSSLRSFRHELLVSNFEGIPLLQQHSAGDDNVPVLHSRRMNQLISQRMEETTHEYVELKGKDHWFGGVMVTLPLRDFYAEVLAGEAPLPKAPQQFELVVANPADMSSRAGITIDQLDSPDQLGKIKIVMNDEASNWSLKTSNILRFHLSSTRIYSSLPDSLNIDDTTLKLPKGTEPKYWFLRSDAGSWLISDDYSWLSKERWGSQLGPIDSIMRTQEPFAIRQLSHGTFDVALQISHNLFQYFAAASNLSSLGDVVSTDEGNVISVALGMDFPTARSPFRTISMIKDGGLCIIKADGKRRDFEAEEGLGAIFLRPWSSQRLELVVWGIDLSGLRQAARLMPMLTGVGQPDFVIVSKDCAWKGAAGVLAMGSFNRFWKVSEASFVK